MYIEMRIGDLLKWTTQAVEAGVQTYIKHTEPLNDRIKQSEAKRYISRMGYKPIMLQKWVDAGLLHKVKSSEKQNAAAWYSLADIKNLITSLQLKEICNNQDN